MDTAVALVQAYLHINGYFTVTEYALVEVSHRHARSRTDLDILAFRFRRLLVASARWTTDLLATSRFTSTPLAVSRAPDRT